MAGSQCLVAFQNSTGGIRAYTSPIGSGTPTLEEGILSFGVSNITATFVGNEWTIFATLQLSSDLLSTNQVWQGGPKNTNIPDTHPMTGDNARSVATIDFRTGQIASNGGNFESRQRRRDVHGILNAVRWGILMPMGAMISAYIVVVAGWATGISLSSGTSSLNLDYLYRNIGTALFSLATFRFTYYFCAKLLIQFTDLVDIQMFALLLRPKPDHKYRLYWNIYHWAVGYAIIGMSVFNVLMKGLRLLDPDIRWWRAYIVTAILLGIILAVLEAITWSSVIEEEA